MSYQQQDNNNQRAFVGFDNGDLALFATPINGSDRASKGTFSPANGKELGFRWRAYTNHPQFRDNISIAIAPMAMRTILNAVKRLASNPSDMEETKWQFMRPAKGGFVTTGDMYKVFRDPQDGNTISIAFRNNQNRYPTFTYRLIHSDATRIAPADAVDGDMRGKVSCEWAAAWAEQMTALVNAHTNAEYAKQIETMPAAPQGGGQGGQRGGWNNNQRGGQQGGYNNQKPQQASSNQNASDTMDFDADISF